MHRFDLITPRVRSHCSLALLLIALVAPLSAQTPLIQGGDPINLRAASISSDGQTILFAATRNPDGTTGASQGSNLYQWSQSAQVSGAPPVLTRLTNYLSQTLRIGVINFNYPGSGDRVAYTSLGPDSNNVEEVHVLQLSTGQDTLVKKDDAPCLQPLALCIDCFASCLRTVHLSPDGKTILYSAARDFPLYTVGADGTGGNRFSIYQASLAPANQRVISQDGTVVFSSSAPFGPTFAATATDLFAMNLDGTNVRQLTHGTLPTAAATQATISKDGTQIAFLATQALNDIAQVWIVRTDGTSLRRLSTGQNPASSPSISDDGSIVSYIQDGQARRISTAPGRLGEILPIAVTNFTVTDPKTVGISGDGQQIALIIGPPQGSPSAVYRTPTLLTSGLADMTPVYAPRFLFSNSVVSSTGLSYASSGSLFTVFGANLIQSESITAPGPSYPTFLNNITLFSTLGALPLQIITPWQINAQIPQSAPLSTVTFQLRYLDSGAFFANPITGPVKVRSPEDYIVQGIGSAGIESVAAAFHAGTRTLADFAHPATRNEVLEIYTTGLGPTTPPVDAGSPSSLTTLSWATVLPRLQIGGFDADVSFGGLVPGLVGVFQVNAKVPSGVHSGSNFLTWIAPDGSQVSHSGIYVK